MAVANITDANFAESIKEGTVLVDLWAPWCGPCKMIAPVLEEVDQEIGDKLKITKLNVDDNPETPGQFGVRGIPTLLVFKDGQMVDQLVGYKPKDQLLDALQKHL